MHAFQAAAAAGGGGGSGISGNSANKSLNAAVMGDALPRGRGIDERAARAAAEVRKKAAARGLLVRPHGGQAFPPLTQFLNLINSGMTPDSSSNNSEAEGAKKEEANGHHDNKSADSKNEPGKLPADAECEQPPEQAPVGLGKGLASLDGKKQKTKPKVSS